MRSVAYVNGNKHFTHLQCEQLCSGPSPRLPQCEQCVLATRSRFFLLSQIRLLRSKGASGVDCWVSLAVGKEVRVWSILLDCVRWRRNSTALHGRVVEVLRESKPRSVKSTWSREAGEASCADRGLYPYSTRQCVPLLNVHQTTLASRSDASRTRRQRRTTTRSASRTVCIAIQEGCQRCRARG